MSLGFGVDDDFELSRDQIIRGDPSNPLYMRKKIPVAVLGATGSVGQLFVELLQDHPWFELKALAASEKSQRKLYGESVQWLSSTPLSEKYAVMPVLSCTPDLPAKIIFSALDSSVASDIEEKFAKAGYVVVSNTKNHRMRPDVPLIIPEVNADHIELIHQQGYPNGGAIITNPNCVVIGLTLSLKPLLDSFGLKSVQVVSMQAVSGAGFPGVASLSILDNVIPYIHEEESKVESEPMKVLAKRDASGALVCPQFTISAQCNRVPVIDGHMVSVFVKLSDATSPEELKQAWKNYEPAISEIVLPSAPHPCIHYFEDPSYPQPRLHRLLGKGMACSIGRLRECSVTDYKYTVLSHNRIRGAAGGAILCAELLVAKGLVFW